MRKNVENDNKTKRTRAQQYMNGKHDTKFFFYFLLFKMTHADSKMIKSRTNRRKSLNCVIKMQKRENFYKVLVFGHIIMYFYMNMKQNTAYKFIIIRLD